MYKIVIKSILEIITLLEVDEFPNIL